jgi:hypothetical protein
MRGVQKISQKNLMVGTDNIEPLIRMAELTLGTDVSFLK